MFLLLACVTPEDTASPTDKDDSAVDSGDADEVPNGRLGLARLEVAAGNVEKALRLNPLHDASYYVLGSLPYLFARRLREGLALLEKAPPNMIVDQSAYMAAAYAHLGDRSKVATVFQRCADALRDALASVFDEASSLPDPFRRERVFIPHVQAPG